MSLFEEVGPDALRALLRDFYDRVFDDVMIGFMFVGKDKERLIEKEWELAARILGGDVPYTGRGLRAAHARSPILSGHFDRRLQILKETMADHGIPGHVRDVWLEHTERMRSLVTADEGSACNHDVVTRRRLPIP